MSFIKNTIGNRGLISELVDSNPEHALFVEGTVVNSNTVPSLSTYNKIYVSPTGNDTTGDGSFSNPFATPGKAVDKIYSYQLPVQPNGAFGFVVYMMSGSYSTWANPQYMTTTFTPIVNGYGSGYSNSTGSIVFTPYFTTGNLGTVNDERFTTIRGPLTPVAVSTTGSRPTYIFATGSFSSTDQDLGKVVRVFNNGNEVYRGLVAFQKVNEGGRDKLTIACSEGDAYLNFTNITASINDRIYITTPSVRINDSVNISNLGTSVLFTGISFYKLSHHGTNGDIGTTNFFGCYFGDGVIEQPFVNISGHVAFGDWAFYNYSYYESIYPGYGYSAYALPDSTGLSIQEQTLWNGWNSAFIGPPGYGAGNTRGAGVFGGNAKLKYFVANGDFYAFQNEGNNLELILYSPMIRGGLVATHTSLLFSSNYPTSLPAIFTNRTINLNTSEVGADIPIMLELETVSNTPVILNNVNYRNDYKALIFKALNATSASNINPLIQVSNTPFLRINATSCTAHGSGSTSDIKVGTLNVASFTTLNSSGSNGIVDSATLTRVGI